MLPFQPPFNTNPLGVDPANRCFEKLEHRSMNVCVHDDAKG